MSPSGGVSLNIISLFSLGGVQASYLMVGFYIRPYLDCNAGPLSSGNAVRTSVAGGSACRSRYVSLDASVADVTGSSGAPWTLYGGTSGLVDRGTLYDGTSCMTVRGMSSM